MEKDNKSNVEPVPYFIHEGTVSRLAECNKKLLIALIVAVVALFLNNVAWIIYEGVTTSIRQQEIRYEQETHP